MACRGEEKSNGGAEVTDAEKISFAKRTLAQIADRVTEYLLDAQSLEVANEALVAIREQAQDALGELMQQEKH